MTTQAPTSLDEIIASGATVMKVKEVAALLRIGYNAAYVSIHRGEIPGVLRLGRSIRVSVPVFAAWLRDQEAAGTPPLAEHDTVAIR